MSFAGFYGECSESQAHALLDACRDLGVDHLDTSNIYGMGVSETMIGSYIAANGNPFRIATKGGIRSDGGKRFYDNSAKHLAEALDASLKRLNSDHVDLYYVHRRDHALPIEEVTETLAALVKSGKIGAFGFSEIAPTSLKRAAAIHPVAAVQSEYSLQTRTCDLGLRQACERLGTVLMAFSPVGRGLLSDTPPDAARIAASDFLRGNPRFQPQAYAANQAQLEPLRAYAADIGLSTAGLAIAWTLAQGPTVIPIPGTRDPAHLAEMVVGATRGLTPAELAEIDRLLPPGWCHGDRYTDGQYAGVERYC